MLNNVRAKVQPILSENKWVINCFIKVNKIQYGRRLHGNEIFFENLTAHLKNPHDACYMSEVHWHLTHK